VSALALGVVLGIVTGLPVGIINVAIVEAASAGRAAFARRLGIGGALADAIHAAIAFVGIGRTLEERPQWKLAMALVTAAVIAMYVTNVIRRRRGRGTEPTRGVTTGFLLTLPNPGAVAAWVAVAAVVWPAIPVADALVLAAGVGAGSALWFTALARWVSSRSGTSRSRSATPPPETPDSDSPAGARPESRPAPSP
jgi:threonine/homoserine/homoserine lactone efflux protein